MPPTHEPHPNNNIRPPIASGGHGATRDTRRGASGRVVHGDDTGVSGHIGDVGSHHLDAACDGIGEIATTQIRVGEVGVGEIT